MSKVIIGPVRLCFPALFEPQTIGDSDEPKYSAQLLIPKSDKKTVQKLRDAEESAKEKGKASKWGGKMPKDVSSIIHDADEDGSAEDYPEREGCLYMNVSSSTKYKPSVVDSQLNPVLDPSEVYSGCYVNVSLQAFPYKYMSKKGVSFGLNHVQKAKDGEPLDGRSTAEDDFEVLSDEDAALI